MLVVEPAVIDGITLHQTSTAEVEIYEIFCKPGWDMCHVHEDADRDGQVGRSLILSVWSNVGERIVAQLSLLLPGKLW